MPFIKPGVRLTGLGPEILLAAVRMLLVACVFASAALCQQPDRRVVGGASLDPSHKEIIARFNAMERMSQALAVRLATVQEQHEMLMLQATKADARLEGLQRTLDGHTQAQHQEEMAYKYAEWISALESELRLMAWFLGALTLSIVGQLGLRLFGYGTQSERGRQRREGPPL